MAKIAPRLFLTATLIGTAAWLYVIGAFAYCTIWPLPPRPPMQVFTPEAACQLRHLWVFFLALTPAALGSFIAFPWVKSWHHAAVVVILVAPWLALVYLAWAAYLLGG